MAERSPEVSLDKLQAALFYLMTRYATRPCPHVADKIVDHLVMLSRHPEVKGLPTLREVYERDVACWRLLAPPSKQSSLLVH